MGYGNGILKYYDSFSSDQATVITKKNVRIGLLHSYTNWISFSDDIFYYVLRQQGILLCMEWDPECNLLATCYTEETDCDIWCVENETWKKRYTLPHENKPTSLIWSTYVGKWS